MVCSWLLLIKFTTRDENLNKKSNNTPSIREDTRPYSNSNDVCQLFPVVVYMNELF